MKTKVLLILFGCALLAGASFADCQKCSGDWPGMHCTAVNDNETGSRDCQTDTWGWCTHAGGGCTSEGNCGGEGEPRCPLFVKPANLEPIDGFDGFLVLEAVESCQLDGLVIEA